MSTRRTSDMTNANYSDDIFAEGYLEAFYKAHVAASRRSNIDEDIAAIEAEIKKVRGYQKKYRGLLVNDHNLNSCGNSECSDDEEINSDGYHNVHDTNPTSVFRIYNSSSPYSPNGRHSPHAPEGMDVFTWSQHQVVTHDHCYMPSESGNVTTPLDQEGILLEAINWNQLTITKRTQALKRLSTILRHRPPSLSYSPTHSSSLSYLPRSVAEFIRTNRGVVAGNKSTTQTQKAAVKMASLILTKDRLISLSNTTSNTVRSKRKQTRQSSCDRVATLSNPTEANDC